MRLIAVLFADLALDLTLLPRFAAPRNSQASCSILPLRAKDAFSITWLLPPCRTFVDTAASAACRRTCRLVGAAGYFARLLPLEPTFLGFRGALCVGRDRTARLDADHVKLVRDLIPRERQARTKPRKCNVDLRLLAARGYVQEPAAKIETDRLFVHDLILPVFIGAYDFERGKTQRVRFSIDVDIRRSTHHAEDMRDVFSYDVIVDAIRLILSRGHVDLVETLAERIADALLAYPRVFRVIARVEKLDVIEGNVGIEIIRERTAEAGSSGPSLRIFRTSPPQRAAADGRAAPLRSRRQTGRQSC